MGKAKSVGTIAVGFVGIPDQLNRTIETTQRKLGGLGKAGKKSGMTLGSVFGKLGNIGLGTFGLAGGIAGGVASLVGAMRSGVSKSFDFQKALGNVASITNLYGKELQDLGDQIKAVAVENGQDLVTSVDAVYQAISAGVPRDNVIDFLRTSSKTAVAGNTDVKTSLDLLTSTIDSFKMTASDAARVSDVWFEAVRLGKTTIPELSESIGTVAPLAEALGVSLPEVAAAFAALTKTGARTNEVATQLRGLFNAMINNQEISQKAAEQIGIAFGPEAVRQAGGFTQWLGELNSKIGGNLEVLKNLSPEIRGFMGVLSLSGAQFENYNKFVVDTTNSLGAMDNAFSLASDNAAFKLSKIGAGFDSLLVSVGDFITNGIERMITAFGGMERVQILFEIFGGAVMGAFWIFQTSLVLIGAGFLIVGSALAFLTGTIITAIGYITDLIGLTDGLADTGWSIIDNAGQQAGAAAKMIGGQFGLGGEGDKTKSVRTPYSDTEAGRAEFSRAIGMQDKQVPLLERIATATEKMTKQPNYAAVI